MILYIMLFGLGFLTAVGISAAVAPLVWRQAQIIARRRAIATLPMRMSDIVAGRDQVRATFIVEMRRLEHQTGDARRRLAEARIEIGRQIEVTAQVTAKLRHAGAAIAALETERDGLAATLAEREASLAETEAARAKLEEESGAKSEQIGRLTTTIADITATSDSRRVEIAALRTKVETLRERIENLERDKRKLDAKLAVLEAENREFDERPLRGAEREKKRVNEAEKEGEAAGSAAARKDGVRETAFIAQAIESMGFREIEAAMKNRSDALSGVPPQAPANGSDLTEERLEKEVNGLDFDAKKVNGAAEEKPAGDVKRFEAPREESRRVQNVS